VTKLYLLHLAGETVLLMAARSSQEAAAIFLAKHGAKPSLANKKVGPFTGSSNLPGKTWGLL